MNVTDEMMDAAYETAGISRTGHAPWKDHLRAALAAALAAAPTVEDAVFCGAHPDGWLVMPHGCGAKRCPGPHRSLLVGPEVES